MPIREYQASNPDEGCDKCRLPFEQLESISAPVLRNCPKCGAILTRLISALRLGASQTTFDQRAKNAGFKKIRKVSKGEYEVKY